MNYYIDFGRECHIMKGNSDEIEILHSDLLDIKNSNIYIEVGCPRGMLARFYKHGCKIYQIEGKKVKMEREHRNSPKTDENDVRTIKKLKLECPEQFKLFVPKDEREIEAALLFSQYKKINKTVVSLKNRNSASEKDLGEKIIPEKWIAELEKTKKGLILDMTKLYPEIKMVQEEMGIKGFGKTYIAELYIAKDPRLFNSKSAYMKYNGFIGNIPEEEKHKYNRFTKSIFWQVAVQTKLNKNPFYCDMYEEKKQESMKRDPDAKKITHHMRALNRMSTHLCKEFWKGFHAIDSQKLLD